MKNQKFQTRTEDERRRKLGAALRQFTGDRLTEEQRRLIGCAIGCHSQYVLQVLEDPGAFCLRVNPQNSMDGQKIFHTIFGDLENLEEPAAVLVRRVIPQGRPCTVYIYLPQKKEEERDDARKETATET